MKTKFCPKCKQEKALTDFPVYKGKSACHCFQCKRNYAAKYRKTIAGIYQNIKGRSKFYGVPFDMEREDFIEWYKTQEKKCVYCDVPEWVLPLLGDSNNQKRQKLNIDRVINEVGYKMGNLALCCTRCNYIKSDFFTFGEMRDIAQRYVKPHWSKIIEKQSTKGEEK